jgi:hypothetical protein
LTIVRHLKAPPARIRNTRSVAHISVHPRERSSTKNS